MLDCEGSIVHRSFPAGLLALALLVPAPASAAETVLAQKGAEVDGTLTTTLSSKSSHDGDAFTLDAKDTWFHKNPLPKGSLIEGHVEQVSPASPAHKASMVVVIDDVKLPDGTTAPFNAKVVSFKEFEPRTHHIRDTMFVLGGAVGGHLLSKHTGVKGGTFGGAAAGFALAASMKSDITVKRGTLVKLRAQDPIVSST
jgi:hypothetical protein